MVNTRGKSLPASGSVEERNHFEISQSTLFLTRPALRKDWLPQPNLLGCSQSLADLGKGNNQLWLIYTILSHLRGRQKLRNTCVIHSPEAQAH